MGDRKVPNRMLETYNLYAEIIEPYCDKYLNEEYKAICLHVVTKLCRKRTCPLVSGNPVEWAAGIIYAMGQNNFIFDPSRPIHMTADEIVEPLGVSRIAAISKAAEIKKILQITPTNAEYVLESDIYGNAGIWFVKINGYRGDARLLPVEVQVECKRKGMIPYVPALR